LRVSRERSKNRTASIFRCLASIISLSNSARFSRTPELLKTYWETLAQQDQVIGGLVWCFVDTDVHRRFEWVYEYRCAYGVYDSNRNPKHAAQVLQELWT